MESPLQEADCFHRGDIYANPYYQLTGPERDVTSVLSSLQQQQRGDDRATKKKKGREKNFAVKIGDNLYFYRDQKLQYTPVKKHMDVLTSIDKGSESSSINTTLNLRSILKDAANLGVQWKERVENLIECTETELRRGSVTEFEMGNIEGERDVIFSISSLDKNFLDLGILRITRKTPVAVTNSFLRRFLEYGKQQRPKSVNDVIYSEQVELSHLNYHVQNMGPLGHSGDMIVECNRKKTSDQKKNYLLHAISLVPSRISELEENQIYHVMLSSYGCTKTLQELISVIPKMYLYNGDALLVQKLYLPINEIIMGKDTCLLVGGILRRGNKLFFITPKHFPVIENGIYQPISSAKIRNYTYIMSELDKFSSQLMQIFNKHVEKEEEEEKKETMPKQQEKKEEMERGDEEEEEEEEEREKKKFRGMIVIQKTPRVIKRFLKLNQNNPDELKRVLLADGADGDGSILYCLMDELELVYFTDIEKVLKCMAECDTTANSSSSSNNMEEIKRGRVPPKTFLALPFTTCHNHSSLLRVSMKSESPFSSFREAVETINDMDIDKVKIYADADYEDQNRDNQHHKAGLCAVSGHLILISDKEKINRVNMSPCNILSPVSQISLWRKKENKERYHRGFDLSRFVEKKPSSILMEKEGGGGGEKRRVLLVGYTSHDEVDFDAVLDFISSTGIAGNMDSDKDVMSLICHQLSLTCDETELRGIIKRLSDEVKREVISLSEQRMQGLIDDEAYNAKKDVIKTFLNEIKNCVSVSDMTTNVDDMLSDPNMIAARAAIANNVSKVKDGSFDPFYDQPGISLLFGLSDCERRITGFGVDNLYNMKTELLCYGSTLHHPFKSNQKSFVIPLYDDASGELKRITGRDVKWNELSQADLPSNQMRICLRGELASKLKLEPSSGETTKALLERLMEISCLVTQEQHKSITEGRGGCGTGIFYQEANRRLFVMLMTTLASGVGYNSKKDKLHLIFHKPPLNANVYDDDDGLRRYYETNFPHVFGEESRGILSVLFPLLASSDIEDKDLAFNNARDNLSKCIYYSNEREANVSRAESEVLEVEEKSILARKVIYELERHVISTFFSTLFPHPTPEEEEEAIRNGEITENDVKECRELYKVINECDYNQKHDECNRLLKKLKGDLLRELKGMTPLIAYKGSKHPTNIIQCINYLIDLNSKVAAEKKKDYSEIRRIRDKYYYPPKFIRSNYMGMRFIYFSLFNDFGSDSSSSSSSSSKSNLNPIALVVHLKKIMSVIILSDKSSKIYPHEWSDIVWKYCNKFPIVKRKFEAKEKSKDSSDGAAKKMKYKDETKKNKRDNKKLKTDSVSSGKKKHMINKMKYDSVGNNTSGNIASCIQEWNKLAQADFKFINTQRNIDDLAANGNNNSVRNNELMQLCIDNMNK